MLKSIDFIRKLELDLNENINLENIVDFYIELRITQKIDVYIVSDKINQISDLFLKNIQTEEIENENIEYIFLTEKKSNDEDYSHLFTGEKTSYGLRRSLGALLTNTENKLTKDNVVTFFSYKGGVGRTTSLALTATFLARTGKNVFVMDCDFEAPGLINFFNSSQVENCKNGLIEYLNDRNFIKNLNIEDYVYNIEKSYSGNGIINLMPAGNIMGSNEDLISYLEGLAKIDLQGERLTNILNSLVEDIKNKYKPDVILIDSRTGFNNVFGALARISNTIVVLAGDDAQNLPGLEYVTKMLNKINVNSCFILSILSNNYSKRFNNFVNQVQGLSSFDTEAFYFDRQNTLEYIGTALEDKEDIDDFVNGENGSVQYQKFFKYILEVTGKKQENNSFEENEIFENQDSTKNEIEEHKVENDEITISIQDKILNEIRNELPDLYAENIEYSDEYINKYFYFRPCMEDLLIPEKCILLGDKGTGKTAFYRALQKEVFFKRLISKAQKTHLKTEVLNVTNFDNDNFEFLGFDEYIKDELFVKKFWIFYIWNSICSKSYYESKNKDLLISLDKLDVRDKIVQLINNNISYARVEEELNDINTSLKKNDKRLIITFDQLDNIVTPFRWNDVIAPLVKIVTRFPYDFIQPKLFLRRDLYSRLSNLTNKNSFSTKIIDLEWSQNEIFSYFLKIVFSYSKINFLDFLEHKLENPALFNQIKKKLKTKEVVHNQLPLDKHLIQPVINIFFGDPKPKKNGRMSTAYEDLYRNIQSADKTVNLRPFIDLITNAINEQDEQDAEKNYRKEAIIGLAYCTSRQVRKNAVVNYLEDLWNEKGNEFVKFFCSDLSNNKVDPMYKKNVLNESLFDKLLEEVKLNNIGDDSIKNGTLEDFKQVLIANKIIIPYMVGSKTRYGFAYLYTNYLGW
ncbi:AAA family ATPase [Acinetobacter bereziniae]|uniref:tyrosine-protein kinase family protein n=1 Tax=Acinetobacter bereziniae TaxID=106648 RepID=UPI0019007ABF|nr:AAA family ATPase [Acinetobacter bereziniae]MBJ8454422.1 AAA family ATPase [Acinetobacter bereziniae]MBJ8458734.1 AAA family ATPase [Acinetobacter bereziniae]